MLRLQPNPTFTAPVEISIPGETKPKTVRFLFRHMDKDEYTAWLAGLPRQYELDESGEPKRDEHGRPIVLLEARKDAEAIPEIVAGWDRADIDTDYSVEALQALMRAYPASAMEIFETHRREMLESKRKNS